MLPSHLDLHSMQNIRVFEVKTEIYALASVVIAALGYVILGISAGQFCSMFLRSHLLAGLFSIILTLFLAAWCGLMWFWGVSWLWSVLPIPLALLLATLLRTSDWLAERNRPRAWLWPALALALPAVAILIAVPNHRIDEIPLVNPGFSPEEYSRSMTAEEQETPHLYEQAWQSDKSDSRQKVVPLLMKASRGKYSIPAANR